MLIRLFEINIVANNILGDSINLIINLCFLAEDICICFLSVGESANSATSDPDIKPEQINNNKQETNGVKKL